ncbi:asparagine synthase-related protein [Candidatus Methanomassiliicoccus intestinalis]|uniref:asparagine synthase-related protein n=1 Tax=Candidatus Methanomassiliicoccus intestinalis TaxID=1406512 RepID=UPI0037DCD82E
MSFRYDKLENSIVTVIKDNVKGKDIGVAFSGGLDSGLVSAIAKEYANSVTLYTCGSENAYDVIMAKDLSEKLGLPWVHVQISKENIEDLIKEMISATGTTDPFTISYELQLFCVCKASKEDCILTGQGADEYFMGCAKFIDQPDDDYEILKNAAVERLLDVSVPCEKKIASHFNKDLVYVYINELVVSEIWNIDPDELKPKDMDSRKSVLKEIAIDLGYPVLAERKKKSSQYGSGTTDLIRGLARKNGMKYNEYIESLCEDVLHGIESRRKTAAVYARVDPIIKAEAERILQQQGSSPSEAVEKLYLKIIADGRLNISDHA